MIIVIHVWLRVRWISVEVLVVFLSKAVAGVQSDLPDPVSSEFG